MTRVIIELLLFIHISVVLFNYIWFWCKVWKSIHFYCSNDYTTQCLVCIWAFAHHWEMCQSSEYSWWLRDWFWNTYLPFGWCNEACKETCKKKKPNFFSREIQNHVQFSSKKCILHEGRKNYIRKTFLFPHFLNVLIYVGQQNCQHHVAALHKFFFFKVSPFSISRWNARRALALSFI